MRGEMVMQRTIIVSVIILLVVVVGGVLVWQLTQEDPAALAEDLLEQITSQTFTGFQERFDPEAGPTDEQLRGAYQRFGQAFDLSRITLADFTPLSRNNTEAEFSFSLNYE